MKQTRAIVMAFHKYTPFGDEFYEPILDFQLRTLEKYKNEFDWVYILDSTWNIEQGLTRLNQSGIKMEGEDSLVRKIEFIKVDPSLRYYDAYKQVLPQIQEDLVLFMDNDMVVYKEGVIGKTFDTLQEKACDGLPIFDVASITDTIGTMKVDLKTGNKFCPYWFASRKELLMKYLDVDWSPDSMPYTETFGLLTEAMLKDGLRAYEMKDDKTEATFVNGEIKTEKNLGYYHIRAGSTPAYLLATKHYGDKKTYDDYLKNQPKSEILRHCDWYKYMGGTPQEILEDLNA